MANMKSIVTDLMLALESVDLPKSFMDKVSNGDIFDDFNISEKFDKFKVLEYIKSKMKTAKVSDDIISKFESEYKSNSENFNKKNASLRTDAKKIVNFINENNLKDAIKDIGNHPLYTNGDESELLNEVLGSDLFEELESLNVYLDFVLEIMDEYDTHGGKVDMNFSRKSNFSRLSNDIFPGVDSYFTDELTEDQHNMILSGEVFQEIENTTKIKDWLDEKYLVKLVADYFKVNPANRNFANPFHNKYVFKDTNYGKLGIFYDKDNDTNMIVSDESGNIIDQGQGRDLLKKYPELFEGVALFDIPNFDKNNFAGNKGVNMSISKEFVPIRENYTEFDYIKKDDEIAINKGSKKLVLKGADAIDWLDTYWVVKYIDNSMNYSRKSNFAGNKRVNMSLSRDFIPTVDNYTKFGYSRDDYEITVNIGSKKLVLNGADAIEWLDSYWNSKNTAMEEHYQVDDSENYSRKSNFAKSVDKLGLSSSGIISDINSTIGELVGDDIWFVDRIRESNGSWIVDASNDNGKKHKIFYMVENDIDTIEEVKNDESNEDFNVIYVSADSNFSRKSNFSIHTMDEWYKRKLKSLKSSIVVHPDSMKDYYDSGKLKVGDYIYIIGDPATEDMVGYVTSIGRGYLIDEEGTELPNIELMMIDSYSLDDLDSEKLSGKSDDFIKKQIKKLIPYKYSNKESISDSEIGMFYFGSIFVTTKSVYDTMYEEIVEDFIYLVREQDNFSVIAPIRSR